ncbi:hypothetical protein ATE84_0486 [Aquimarina sp. MAR_2010_214]|uniref:hypothetical protein n=1 Tax=Aquimarina sp. MAR_2010_214 TaxID=1250026 RepID=UPI000C6FEF9F|nr:hypothetical protein [Aquimarina sp. MAR_2010_214]PKV48487.1 hypothetical protein ATE84_0486 [Aquimarina sp. MAR_2010_214]
MKKLFLLLFVLGAGLSTQAQENNWQEVHELHRDKLYPLAKDVADMTDMVIANGNIISIVKDNGTTSLVKERAKDMPVEYYNYKLITSNGRSINLDLMMTNKVVDKFFDVLRRVKDNTKGNDAKEIRAILNSL